MAARFTEEHRATLDWLNEITDDRFNFFGLEVELWRIGPSPVAPKFNVVSKPNDWSRTVADTAKIIEAADLTETQRLQLDYWRGLWRHLEEAGSFLKGTKPLPQNWINFAVGRSAFGMHASISTQKSVVAVGLSCYGPHSKAHFRLLERQRADVEREVGGPLEWEELPHRKESRVRVRRDADPSDRADWPRQHRWVRETLEAFHRAFASRVKDLDASQVEAAG